MKCIFVSGFFSVAKDNRAEKERAKGRYASFVGGLKKIADSFCSQRFEELGTFDSKVAHPNWIIFHDLKKSPKTFRKSF